MIRIGVVGALGKMGREVIKAVCAAEDMKLVLAVDIQCEGEDIGKIVKSCFIKSTSQRLSEIVATIFVCFNNIIYTYFI